MESNEFQLLYENIQCLLNIGIINLFKHCNKSNWTYNIILLMNKYNNY